MGACYQCYYYYCCCFCCYYYFVTGLILIYLINTLLAIVTWLFSESPQFNKTKYLQTVLSASCNSYFSNSCHTMIVNAFPLALIYLLLHHSIVLFGITFDTLTYNIIKNMIAVSTLHMSTSIYLFYVNSHMLKLLEMMCSNFWLHMSYCCYFQYSINAGVQLFNIVVFIWLAKFLSTLKNIVEKKSCTYQEFSRQPPDNISTFFYLKFSE